MKVLILTQYFWPEGFPINGLAQSLAARGIELEVLTGKPNYPEGAIFPGYRAWGCMREQYGGIPVFRLPLVARGAKSALRLALNYLSFVASGLLFGPWLLRKRQYDVIFVYAPSPIFQAIPALFLGWFKGSKVVVWVQDLWPESLAATGHVRHPSILKLVERIVQFIYNRTDLLLVQSRAFESPVKALGPGTPVAYYPNSVDPVFCKPPTTAAPDIAGLEDGFTVVFAGNIGSAQAVETIVEAATLLKQHEGIRFIVVGQGSRREWMQQEAAARGLTNLVLPGRYPMETMPALMQKASALLVTLADQPIFEATVPSKVQAYMAAGKPIVACLNGEGARLVTEGEAGVTAPAEDAGALAEAVLTLFRMTPAERERLGGNGRRYFETHFDHDLLVDDLIGHFRKLCLSGRPSR